MMKLKARKVGIDDSICFNYPFEFVFTTNVGDSFPFGSNKLPLDSLRLGTTSAVSGLPTGISYACDPPSCTFLKGTRGCVILKGIVKDASEIGDHELKLSGTLYANGSSSGLNLTFPSPLIAPGKYTLTVLPANASKCEKLDADGPDLLTHSKPTPTLPSEPSNSRFLKICTMELCKCIHLPANWCMRKLPSPNPPLP